MKTKNLIFKLMMIVISLFISGDTWGFVNLAKLVKILPGDTISTSQLTVMTKRMHERGYFKLADAIVVRNGGDFTLKFDKINLKSLIITTDSIALEKLTIDSISSSLTITGLYILSYTPPKSKKRLTIQFLVNYELIPLLDGKELMPDQIITIKTEEDTKKTIAFPQNWRQYQDWNIWVVKIPEVDMIGNAPIVWATYDIRLEEIIHKAREWFKIQKQKNKGIITITIKYNHPGNWELYIASEQQKDETTKKASANSFCFTIKDERPDSTKAITN